MNFLEILKNLNNAIQNKDKCEIKKIIKDNGLILKNGKIYIDDSDQNALDFEIKFWDQRSLSQKILMNSLYRSYHKSWL